MTVRINFLPRNYQPPKQLGAKEWGMAAAAAVAVVATGVYYTSVYASAGALERQAETDRAKLQRVRAGLAQAAEIKNREQSVAQLEQIMKSLQGRDWSPVLLSLRELTPQHVTWTALKIDGDSAALKGTSRGLVDVAQLLGGLVNHSGVEAVTLKYVNEKGIPVTVAAKAGDKDAGGVALPSAEVLGTFRQLEFDMVITLVPLEGGQKSGS